MDTILNFVFHAVALNDWLVFSDNLGIISAIL